MGFPVALGGALATASAQSTSLTYQCRVTAYGTNFTGNGQFKFALVTSDHANPKVSYTTFWSNDGTSVAGSEPATALIVGVTNGLFTVVLGDIAQPGMAALDASLFAQTNLQLRIWFNDGLSGFAALDPPQNLTPAPYAVSASVAVKLLNGLMVQSNTNGAPNVIGGASVNNVSSNVIGATIAGGGAANYSGDPVTNSVTGDFTFSNCGTRKNSQ